MTRSFTSLFLSGLIVVAACGGDDPPATTTVPTTIASTTTPSTTATTQPSAAAVWPLTGLAADVDPADAPLLVAKVDNSPRSRPQLGLADADLVIEVLVEGGVARFLAFFQSQIPDEVGPIRSTREVDPELLEPFGALFASSGGQGFVLSDVRLVAGDVGHHTLGGGAYHRAEDRPSLYGLMLRTADTLGAEDAPEPPTDDWLVHGPPPDGEQALTVDLSLSASVDVNYRYSASDGGYLRSHGEEPHVAVDGDGNETQLVAANVVVVYVDVLDTGRTDSAGSPVPDYQVTGSGEAVLFRDGVAIPGTWERETATSFFRFVDDSGTPLTLAQGATWLELTPNGRLLEWQ